MLYVYDPVCAHHVYAVDIYIYIYISSNYLPRPVAPAFLPRWWVAFCNALVPNRHFRPFCTTVSRKRGLVLRKRRVLSSRLRSLPTPPICSNSIEDGAPTPSRSRAAARSVFHICILPRQYDEVWRPMWINTSLLTPRGDECCTQNVFLAPKTCFRH